MTTETITRTITYPAPETEAPALGAQYYLPDPFDPSRPIALKWESYVVDRFHLHQGLVYLTKKDAIARAKAMLE